MPQLDFRTRGLQRGMKKALSNTSGATRGKLFGSDKGQLRQQESFIRKHAKPQKGPTEINKGC